MKLKMQTLVASIMMLAFFASTAGAVSKLPEFTDLVDKAGPAVVNISTVKTVDAKERMQNMFRAPGNQGAPFEDFFDQFEKFFNAPNQGKTHKEKRRSLGSGFLISADGYIVTNNHVIADADEVHVQLADSDKSLDAKVIGRDPELDLALIKIEDGKDLPYLEFGNSEDIQIGEWVVAIGNPFGLQSTVTAGIISAVGRVIGAGPFDNFIQTDASINPGNSGGPLLNMDGKIVGINTAIIASGQGIGFAIPSNMAKDIIEQLRTNKKVQRGWLGVTIQNIDDNTAKALGMPNTHGALITSVLDGEPAAKAGIKSGDVIIKVDGNGVEDTNELLRRIASIRPGQSAEITILRKGNELNLDVVLGQRDVSKAGVGEDQSKSPDEGEKLNLGMTLRTITSKEAEALGLEKVKGLLVTEVESASPAEDSDIRPGDVILEANQQTVNSIDEFKTVLKDDAKKKGVVMLLIKRQRQNIFRTIALPE